MAAVGKVSSRRAPARSECIEGMHREMSDQAQVLARSGPLALGMALAPASKIAAELYLDLPRRLPRTWAACEKRPCSFVLSPLISPSSQAGGKRARAGTLTPTCAPQGPHRGPSEPDVVDRRGSPSRWPRAHELLLHLIHAAEDLITRLRVR